MMNAGERLTVNNCTFGYLSHRIVFYLLNLHIKSRHTYFARVSSNCNPRLALIDIVQAGTSREEDSYKADASLSEIGRDYARKMGDTLIQYREEERKTLIDRGGTNVPLHSLTVWSSNRRRTGETAQYLADRGYTVRKRSTLSQLNPGSIAMLSETQIRREYPDEVAKHEADPYHHRYPRAEVSDRILQRLEP